MSKEQKAYQLRLDPDLYDKLCRLAKEDHRSLAGWMKVQIEKRWEEWCKSTMMPREGEKGEGE